MQLLFVKMLIKISRRKLS